MFIDAWKETSNVKVYTNPKAVQLVLFPKEEVEYFSVNLTVFKGDMWDGRKAAAQHLRQRFKYRDPSRILSVNDWFYSDHGSNRPESYLRSAVVPALKEMGFDTLQMDALWSTTRDTVVPNAETFTTNLPAFAHWVNSQGLNIGYWISLTGAKWGRGRDLADPATIRLREKQMEEVVIPLYHIKWQQIDSGELFKNDNVTTYSHPSDSVYRKFLNFKSYCNYISHKYPDILIRETSEFENLFKGGSSCLMGINDNTISGNFWGSNGGMEGVPMFAKDLFSYFGEYPAEGMFGYVGPLKFDASVAQMYQWLTARDIDIYTDPDLFSAEDIARVRKFTDWIHNPRIKSLLNEMACPTASSGTFEKLAAPYLWMFVNQAKDKALLIGTTAESAPALTANLRWLDSSKTYLLEDISLYNDGVVRYAFNGKKTGAELKAPGFTVNFANSGSLAKAFWIQELTTNQAQVLYADDKIKSFSEHWTGTSLVVKVKGIANNTGAIVVYKSSVADTEVKPVILDAAGEGVITFDSSSVTGTIGPPVNKPGLQSTLALWAARKAPKPYFSPAEKLAAQKNLALGKVATASSFADSDSAPAKAIDGQSETSWSSAFGQTNNQWLDIDFGAVVCFDKVLIQEHEPSGTIGSYTIQAWSDGWFDVAVGEQISRAKIEKFPPVFASKIRLNIETATAAPTISEFAVFQTKTPAVGEPK
ncbi:MAG: discoidin domain-containing protein [Limisphaerales bacterium]